MLSAKFYEEFLDDIQLDIDFSSQTKKLQVKTEESTYRESVDLPTLTQLINQKSEEFIDAILVDMNTFVEVEINDVTEYSDSTSYEVEAKFRTKIGMAYADLADIYFGNSMLELDSDTVKDFQKFVQDNKFTEKKAYAESPNATYTLKIENTNQLNTFLNKFETLSGPHRNVTSIKDLDESLITKFNRYNIRKNN